VSPRRVGVNDKMTSLRFNDEMTTQFQSFRRAARRPRRFAILS
jgi:hypothetical protein